MTTTELPEIQGPAYHGDTHNGLDLHKCAVCGKATGRKGTVKHVRLDHSLVPIPWDDPRDEDHETLGAWPIGRECAKRFPAGYIGDLDLGAGDR